MQLAGASKWSRAADIAFRGLTMDLHDRRSALLEQFLCKGQGQLCLSQVFSAWVVLCEVCRRDRISRARLAAGTRRWVKAGTLLQARATLQKAVSGWSCEVMSQRHERNMQELRHNCRGGRRMACEVGGLRSKLLEQSVLTSWRQQLLDARAALLCSRQQLLESVGLRSTSDVSPGYRLRMRKDFSNDWHSWGLLRHAVMLWRWCVVLDWCRHSELDIPMDGGKT